MPRFERLDILMAYTLLIQEHHDPHTLSVPGAPDLGKRLARIGFRFRVNIPGSWLSAGEGSLSANGRAIYREIVRRYAPSA